MKSDLQFIPEFLVEKSLSKLEIVLEHDDALDAVNYLVEKDCFVFAWEGWIKHADNRYGHSGDHQGTVEFWGTRGHSIQERITEAADFIRETISASQQRWDDKPEVIGATLYFCLSIRSLNEKGGSLIEADADG